MYRYYVNKRSPIASWILDDSVPFQECSGVSASGGKKSGTSDPTTSVPLVAGAGFSSVFKSTSVGQFACNLFKQGLEQRPFALESWVLPIQKSSGFEPRATSRMNLSTRPFANAVESNGTTGHHTVRNGRWFGQGAGTGTYTLITGITDSPIPTQSYIRKKWTSATVPTGNGDTGFDVSSYGTCGEITAAATGGTIPVVEGEQYSFSYYMRPYSPAGTKTGVPNVYQYNSSGVYLSRVVGSTTTMTSQVWYRHKMTYTVPAGVAFIRFVADINGGVTWAQNDQLDITGILVEKSATVGSYFDAKTYPGVKWVGTENASQAYMPTNISTFNMFQYSNGAYYATAPAQYGLRNNRWGSSGTYTNRTGIDGPAGTELTTCARMTYNGTSVYNSRGFHLAGNVEVTTPEVDTSVPTEAGKTYTVSAYIRASSGVAAVTGIKYNLAYRFINEASRTWNTATQTVKVAAVSTSWYRISTTITAPPGTTYVSLNLMMDDQTLVTAVSGEYIEVTGAMMQEASAPNTYFDGNYDHAEWAGTANQSYSEIYQSAADQQILSHSGIYDGLSINDKVVRFGTSYASAGDAFCSYDLQECQLAHIVGTHSADQNQLWVNGELVDSVDITDAQKADSYDAAADGNLYSGYTVSSAEVAMNAVAFYPSLSGEQIKQNYAAGIDFIGQARVSPQYGGVPLSMSAASGSVFLDESWVSKADFNRGLKNNVEYAEDSINPAYVADVSVAGNWTTGVPLDGQGDTSIYGVMVQWSGLGITVDASLNGSAWTPAVSGELVSIITSGYDPTNKDLHIRVSFAGGSADDTSYLESLRVIGFRDNAINNITNRAVTIVYPAVPRNDFEPNLYRDDNGIYLDGTTMTIGTDSGTDPDVARTVEIWWKPRSGGLTHNITGTTYRNGAVSTTPPVGEWSLTHIVASADIATSITLAGDIIIGQVAIYPTALSAGDVENVWNSYTGQQVVRFSDSGGVEISEGATPTAIYAHDWSIDSAG